MFLPKHKFIAVICIIMHMVFYGGVSAQVDYLKDQYFYVPPILAANDDIGTLNLSFVDSLVSPVFSILEGNESEAIQISNTGLVEVLAPEAFNYGTNPSLDFLIKVEGENGSDSAALTIYITNPANTVYVDPSLSNPPSEDGSYAHPYASWWDVTYTNGYAYFQKRGTSFTGRLELDVTTDIIIGAYGDGNKPQIDANGGYNIIDVRGARNIDISNMEIFNCIRSGVNAPYETRSSDNIKVRYCHIHHCNVGIGGASNSYYFGNVIHDILEDGFYIVNNPNAVVENNYLYNINTRFFDLDDPASADESEAPGDGIQIGGSSSGFIVRGNYINRGNTGFKFCIISTGESTTNFVIENNVCIGPLKQYPGSSVFLNGDNGAFRYNKISDATHGIYNHSSNLIVNHNIFENNNIGIHSGVMSQVCNNVFYGNGSVLTGANYEFINNIIYLTNASQGTINASNVTEQTNIQNIGTGNSNRSIVDPQFLDVSAGDFRIGFASPCRDAGTELSLYTDFYGNDIPYNGTIDIGIHEFFDDGTNYPPTANIENSKSAKSGDTVVVSAAESFDPNNDTLEFFWIVSPTLDNRSDVPSEFAFIAPVVESETDYTFSVYVFDGEFYSDTVETIVSVRPNIGEANIIGVHANVDDGNLPENTLDNDLDTRWSGNGDSAWIDYELDALYNLNYISMAWFRADERTSYFGIYASVDSVNWISVVAYDSTRESHTDFQDVSLGGIEAKYVRVTGYGNSMNEWNSILETRIYGEEIIVSEVFPVVEESISLFEFMDAADEDKFFDMKVYTLLGASVSQQKVNSYNELIEIVHKIENSGVYIVQVSNQKQSYTTKMYSP
jgi:hypothetical protein